MEKYQKTENFRIVETTKGFNVQRKFIITEEIPTKWWQNRKYCIFTNFENVNENGSRITIPFGKYHPLNHFKTLEEAKKAIEGFKKYPVYYYFNEKPEFPKDRQ